MNCRHLGVLLNTCNLRPVTRILLCIVSFELHGSYETMKNRNIVGISEERSFYCAYFILLHALADNDKYIVMKINKINNFVVPCC